MFDFVSVATAVVLSACQSLCALGGIDSSYGSEEIIFGETASYSVCAAECSMDICEEQNFESYSSVTEYETFLEAYFSNLTMNFGNNLMGSCGYVAISSLLSYFDTYLNDDIIPDEYDVISTGGETDMNSRKNSPGIRYEDVSKSDLMYDSLLYDITLANAYARVVSDYSIDSFHSYLIGLGIKLGYYDFNDESSPCGTSFTQQENILISYLSADLGYKIGSDFDIYAHSGGSQSDFIKYIKQYIDEGLPVMVGISGPYGNHEVIAYAYDNDNIYAHYGWRCKLDECEYCGEYPVRHSLINNIDFNSIVNIMTVKFKRLKGLHRHTNNYALKINGLTTYYCYCNCNIVTYKQHEHAYGAYNYYNDKYHRSSCLNCGEYISRLHQAKVGSEYTSGGHTYTICVVCNGTVCIDDEPIIGGL